MDSSAARGKSLILIIAISAICLSIASIGFYNLTLGFGKITSQVLRLGLTVLLFMFVYYGEPWSKWVTGGLMVVAGVIALISGINLSDVSALSFIPMIMGVVYLVGGLLLLFSRDVSSFHGAPEKDAIKPSTPKNLS